MKSIQDYLDAVSGLFEYSYFSTVAAASVLGAFLLFVNLCINFVGSWTKLNFREVPRFYDPAELKRSVVSYLMIFIISPIMVSIKNIGEIMAGFFGMDPSDAFGKIKGILTKMALENAESSGLWGAVTGLADIANTSALIDLCFKATFIFFMVVKMGILLFSNMALAFIITVSPFAAAFSILGFMKEQMVKLVKIGMNLAFVGMTLKILDMFLFNGVFDIVEDSLDSNMVSTRIVLSAICFVMIIAYLLSIWLTSLYVGSPAAGAMISMAATMATAAAMMAANVGTSAIGGMAASGGAAGGKAKGGVSDKVNQAINDLDKE